MTQKTLSITGMSCEHCVGHVKEALEGVDGVDSAEVSLDANSATVNASTDVLDGALTDAVKAAGYEATVN
jgi:copper chaperone CopZ